MNQTLLCLFLCLLYASIHNVQGFVFQRTSKIIPSVKSLNHHRRNRMKSKLYNTVATLPSDSSDIPPEIMKLQPINNMILVERISTPTQTDSGIHIARSNDREDRKKLGKILSIPKTRMMNRNGRSIPVEELFPFKVGDIVLLNDAWGIGPMHLEYRQRFFSFHKVENVLGVISQGEESSASN